MILEDLSSNIIYEVDEVEYLIDDDIAIGEVYLDGKLVFQADDIYDKDSLKEFFFRQFSVIEGEESEDIFADYFDS